MDMNACKPWLAGIALLALISQPALAADNCAPLKLVNDVPLKMTAGDRRALVPVTINGVEETFLLDTAGFASQIWPSVAKKLALPIGDSAGKITDFYGHAAESEAMVSKFGLGRLLAQDTSLLISTSTFDQEDGPYVGLLAADFMGRYDTELDFAGGKMRYFSTDHCDGHVIYWPAGALAVVDMRFGSDHHIVVPVTLDGHPFKATLDTGSPNTLIRAPEAKRVFALDTPGSGDTPMPDLDGMKRFGHVFSKLEFDGIAINNPHVVVFPDLVGKHDPNNDYQTGSRVARVDDVDSNPAITIGMNILSKLHLYIAFKERKLYITPAAAPAAPQPAAQ